MKSHLNDGFIFLSKSSCTRFTKVNNNSCTRLLFTSCTRRNIIQSQHQTKRETKTKYRNLRTGGKRNDNQT